MAGHLSRMLRGQWPLPVVNGVKETDLHDDMTKSGFIGLQVHSVGKREDPLQVRWRNLRLRELAS